MCSLGKDFKDPAPGVAKVCMCSSAGWPDVPTTESFAVSRCDGVSGGANTHTRARAHTHTQTHTHKHTKLHRGANAHAQVVRGLGFRVVV